jgi:hypothetical protein
MSIKIIFKIFFVLSLSYLMMSGTLYSQKKQKKANQIERLSVEFSAVTADYFGLFPNIENIEKVEIVENNENEMIFKVTFLGGIKEFKASGIDIRALRYYIDNRESFDIRAPLLEYGMGFRNLRISGILLPKEIQAESKYEFEIIKLDDKISNGYLFYSTENFILISDDKIYDWKKSQIELIPANNIKNIKILPNDDKIIIEGNKYLYADIYRKLRIMDCLPENDFAENEIYPPELNPTKYNLKWEENGYIQEFEKYKISHLKKIQHSVSLVYPIDQLLEDVKKYGLNYQYMMNQNQSLFAEYTYISVANRVHDYFSIEYLQEAEIGSEVTIFIKKVTPEYKGEGFSFRAGSNFYLGTEIFSNILPLDDWEVFFGASAIYQKINFQTQFEVNPSLIDLTDKSLINVGGVISNFGIKLGTGIYYKLFEKLYIGSELGIILNMSNRIDLGDFYLINQSSTAQIFIKENDDFNYLYDMSLNLRIFL